MADVDLISGGPWMQVTVALMLVLTVVMLLILFLFKRDRTPPGPCGAPLLGYLPYFDSEFHLTFNALRETYGDVISISFGSWSAIVVSGYATIKEALVTREDDFSARPAFTSFRMLNDGKDFGGGPFDEEWKALHGVVSSAIGKFMHTKTDFIEDIVRAEVTYVVGNFTAHKQGDSFNPKKVITTANFRVMHQLSFGKVESASQNESLTADHVGLMDIAEFKKSNPLFDAMPWLRYVRQNKISCLKDLIKMNERRRSTRIAEHESTLTMNGPPRDLADCLIQASNESLPVGLDKKRVTESLDFLIQGNGTTGSALQWLVLLMAAYPDVQEKVFKEINNVVGKGRPPALADRGNMNYVEATIAECLRFASPVPLAIPHSAIRDTTLREFDIKKDTVVFFNLHSIYTDKGLWGDPEKFRPERMLTLEGQLNKTQVNMVSAFSMGRRSCTASSLARDLLFLFLSTLVQRVILTRPPGEPDYSMEGHYNPTRQPKDFQICVTARD